MKNTPRKNIISHTNVKKTSLDRMRTLKHLVVRVLCVSIPVFITGWLAIASSYSLPVARYDHWVQKMFTVNTEVVGGDGEFTEMGAAIFWHIQDM